MSLYEGKQHFHINGMGGPKMMDGVTMVTSVWEGAIMRVLIKKHEMSISVEK